MRHINIKQRGVGLVELMVGIAVGLIITAAAATIYISTKRSYSLQEDMGRIQENGRFAIHFIKYDARMAGYFGCTMDTPHIPIDNNTDSVYNILNGKGLLLTDTLGPYLTSSVYYDANADTFSLYYFSSASIQPSSLGTDVSGNTTIVLPNSVATIGWSAGKTLGISNCANAEVLNISGISNDGQTLTLASGLMGDYPMTASEDSTLPEIHLLQSLTYQINGTDNELQRQYGAGNFETLVEGIETWQFRFGLDQNPTVADMEPDTWVTASNVTNWGQVRGVRMAILSRSLDEYGSDSDTPTDKEYDLLNNDDDAGTADFTGGSERVRRRVFRSSFMTRNQ